MPRGPAPFLSDRWVRAAKTRIEQEPAALRRLLGDLDLSLVLIVKDRPGLDAEAVLVRVHAGHLAEVDWGSRASFEAKHAAADFTITAAYETYARIHAGSLTERGALLSGKVHVRGPYAKALALLRTVVQLNRMLREVPAAYGEASDGARTPSPR